MDFLKLRTSNPSYYVMDDESSLSDLTVSKTVLSANQETKGNSSDVDEVYFFNGAARMTKGSEVIDINAGDCVLVGKNLFRKVHNTTAEPLEFFSVWKKE